MHEDTAKYIERWKRDEKVYVSVLDYASALIVQDIGSAAMNLAARWSCASSSPSRTSPSGRSTRGPLREAVKDAITGEGMFR
jgi:hypothetical protein